MQIAVCRGDCRLHHTVMEPIVSVLTPDSHGTDSPHVYAVRREACRISHTDGDNAPVNYQLTTTKYAQESLRALSFRKLWISPLLKASPECPLRDMRQASRLDGGWRCENCTAVRTVLAMAKLRTAGVTGLYSYTDCSGCGKTAGDFQCTERAR